MIYLTKTRVGENAMIATTVPVHIDAEAQERIEKIGMRKEFEQMLDHAMQTIPGLVRIEVSYIFNYMYAPEDPVEIAAFVTTDDLDEQLRIYREWNEWRFSAFTSFVNLHFTVTAMEFIDAV